MAPSSLSRRLHSRVVLEPLETGSNVILSMNIPRRSSRCFGRILVQSAPEREKLLMAMALVALADHLPL